MATILLGVGLFGVFFMLMMVRVLLVKNGEFKGTCASQSPFLNKNGETCSYCGKPPGSCEKVEPLPVIKKQG